MRIARRRQTAVELPPRCLGGPHRRAELGVRALSAFAGVLTDNFGFGVRAAVVGRLTVQPVCPQLRKLPCAPRQLRLVPRADVHPDSPGPP